MSEEIKGLQFLLQETTNLDDIIITEMLLQRPKRRKNIQRENKFFASAVDKLARKPEEILQFLIEAAVDLCQADSAGISLLEPADDGKQTFRWVALAGQYANYVGGTTPRDFSPCGISLDRHAPQLYLWPARYFTYFMPITPPIVEGLVIPFYVDHRALGTIWILSHQEQRHFDGEDLRIMTSLGQFTAAAWQVSSARFAAEEAARLEQRARQQIETAFADHIYDFAIFALDATGHVIRWNEGAKRITGWSADEIGGQPVTRLYTLQDVQSGRPESIMRAAASQGTACSQGWYVRKDETQFWAEEVVTALRDDHGQVRGYITISRDITERKRNDDALRASEERFRVMAETVTDLLFTCQSDGWWNYVNQRFAQVVGKPTDAVLGWAWLATLHPDDLEHSRALWQRALTTGEPFDHHFRIRRADGTYGWFMVSARPVRDTAGQIVMWIGSCTDITGLVQARAEAEEANRSKSRFLAAASHDLRQPLNSLSLLIGVLRERVGKTPAVEIVDRIQDALGVLIELFNALLDLSKFETGAVEIHRTAVAGQTLLDRLDSDFRPVAHGKGLELRIAPSSAVLWTDTLLLERIVRNLVSNAVRYTQAGRVLIGCRRRGTSVRIDVLDTGLGIPQEQLSSIFEEFHQLDNPARMRQGGSGLGLAIVKRAADLLGHPVEIASLSGRGSRFSITVPLAPPEEVRSIRMASPEMRPVRGDSLSVLVVEDDPLVTVAMRLALEEFGCRVTTVASKEEAIAVLGTLPRPPALVIADYRLPDGDGITLIEEVRRRGNAPIRACLVTGDLDPNLPAHFQSPDECFLYKPIQAEDLRKLVDAARADTRRDGHGGSTT